MRYSDVFYLPADMDGKDLGRSETESGQPGCSGAIYFLAAYVWLEYFRSSSYGACCCHTPFFRHSEQSGKRTEQKSSGCLIDRLTGAVRIHIYRSKYIDLSRLLALFCYPKPHKKSCTAVGTGCFIGREFFGVLPVEDYMSLLVYIDQIRNPALTHPQRSYFGL